MRTGGILFCTKGTFIMNGHTADNDHLRVDHKGLCTTDRIRIQSPPHKPATVLGDFSIRCLGDKSLCKLQDAIGECRESAGSVCLQGAAEVLNGFPDTQSMERSPVPIADPSGGAGGVGGTVPQKSRYFTARLLNCEVEQFVLLGHRTW